MKYQNTDISLPYIVSRPTETWYFSDISLKFHDILIHANNHRSLRVNHYNCPWICIKLCKLRWKFIISLKIHIFLSLLITHYLNFKEWFSNCELRPLRSKLVKNPRLPIDFDIFPWNFHFACLSFRYFVVKFLLSYWSILWAHEILNFELLIIIFSNEFSRNSDFIGIF